MWIKRAIACRVRRYLRCMQRYADHAVHSQSLLPYVNEYREYHRGACLLTLEELKREFDACCKNNNTYRRSRYCDPVDSSVLLIAIGLFNRVAPIFWIPCSVMARIERVIGRFDNNFASAGLRRQDAIDVCQELSMVNSDLHRLMVVTSCKDFGDIWPTDSFEDVDTIRELSVEMRRIADHDRLSTWRGRLGSPSHSGYSCNPLCDDEVSVDVEVVDGVIRQMRFRGQGCVVSQACASMLCEGVEGKSIEELLKATPKELMEFEIRELTMNRQRCALVGYEALMRAIKET